MSGAAPVFTPTELRAAREPPARFTLVLPGRAPLVAEQVYRHLPGRRLVFRARSGADTLLIKLFFRRRDYRRECAGLARLHAARIPAPALRWQFRTAEAALLAIEFLPDAPSLAQRLHIAPPADADIAAALALLGALHRAGLIQTDPHPDNFLIRAGIAHAIDGAGIRRAHTARARRANLALFLAQFEPLRDQGLPCLLPAYGAPPPDLPALVRAVARERGRRLRAYRRKSLRTCTEFVAKRRHGCFVVRRRESADTRFLELLANPDAAMAGALRLKDGNSATVARVSGADVDLVVKRYNIKDWRRALRRALRPSRAWVSWRNANALAHIGVSTPRALALREERWGPLRRGAYLISAASAGVSLQDWVEARGAGELPAWLDRALLDMLAALAGASLSHGDLKASNFLVEEASQRLLLIDLDAMRLHRCARSAQRALRRDRERFLANWDGELRRHFARLLAPLAVHTPRRRQER